MSDVRPPRFFEALLERVIPENLSGQGLMGDLAEEFARRARSAPIRARLWYVGQTVSVVAHRAVGAGRTRSASDSDLLTDVRWSVRLVAKHPGFALGVVSILGLGLGANAAVYSVVDGTFRNTSWWAAPERTVAVWPGKGFSFGQLTLYQEEQGTYTTLGGFKERAFAVRASGGESVSANGVAITPALFRELSVQPRRGRALADDDALPGGPPVVVLGEGLWRRAFGADPGIVGRTVDVGGAAMTVVGVQGSGARAPGGRAELWVPLAVDPRDEDYWRAHDLTLVGVLRPGADLDDAFESLAAFHDRISGLFPAFYPPGFADGLATVARADEAQRRLVSTPLLLLLGGTGLLLLVTALNVGNLLLGRAIERRRELAVRSAIGAGRGRIVAQLLVEAAVLCAGAAALGLATAALGGPWMARLFVGEAVVASSSVLSPPVLAFVAAGSLAAWVVLAGVPVTSFLRGSAGTLQISPASGTGAQRVLVTVQAGLATVLLISATLLVSTVDNLRRVPLGFDGAGLLAVELSPPEDRVASPSRARTLYDGLVERGSSLPGVRAAGLTGWLPLRTQAPTTPVNLQTAPVEPAQALQVPMHRVDPGFFEAFGVEASEGRLLDSRERRDLPSGVVVNETLAGLLWPGASAVGQGIAIDPHAWNRWVPVVGVIPDIRSGDITGPPEPALYVSLAESPARDVTLVLRAGGGPVDGAVRRAVADVDPLVPVRSVTWMEDVVREAYATAWVVMGLLVALAALATVLGAIGIYAVLARHVASSRREMGVRMALGARPSLLVGRVVRSGLLLAGVGIVMGCLAAVASTRYLESLLFGVSALEPVAFLTPAATLAAAAAFAAWLPATRAGRLPPAEALRGE